MYSICYTRDIPYIVLWFNVCNKELLALRNNFRVTKKFLIAKFDCTIFFILKVLQQRYVSFYPKMSNSLTVAPSRFSFSFSFETNLYSLLILPSRKGYLHQDKHHETQVVWNSNLMIPDFPIDIRIRLAELKFSFVAS